MAPRITAIATELGDARNDYGASVHCAADEVSMAVTVAVRAMAQVPSTALHAIVFASSGIRHHFPCVAAAIASALRTNCLAFDVGAGCAGMSTGIGLASALRGRVLVVGADLLSRTIDPLEPSHAVLRAFADGAAAVLIDHDADHGYQLLGAVGRTAGEWRQHYGSANGKLIRTLPANEKAVLRATYIRHWTQIGAELFAMCPPNEERWVYASQGDPQLFPELRAALGIAEDHLVRTVHGHAGGADPWIGLLASPPPAGSNVLMLSSGIGFTFHGLLLKAG